MQIGSRSGNFQWLLEQIDQKEAKEVCVPGLSGDRALGSGI